MDEVFKGLSLEMTIGSMAYDVEKAYWNQNKHLFVIASYDNLEKPELAKLNISDSVNIYSTDVKVIDCNFEDGKATLTCEVPPISYDFIRRSTLRLRTNIPADYVYLKATDESEELVPISIPKKGAIRDLSPHGACIELNKDQVAFITNYKVTPVYIKIGFVLPEDNGVDHPMEFIGKVVNVKRSWKADNIGIMFLTKNYSDFRMVEHYCNKYLEKQRQEENPEFGLTVSKALER